MFQVILQIAITDPEEAAWMLGRYHFNMARKTMQRIKNRAQNPIKKKALYNAYRQGVKAK